MNKNWIFVSFKKHIKAFIWGEFPPNFSIYKLSALSLANNVCSL